ncbi:Hypothetical protein, putative [Bodo saltans]|uniref:Uncharacterized protein n=1 Tax=Bodo saltans TaxID=75058 RepID=A0A0S4JC72_BODSA|nr:Hypothetical protein, putative [Bodo saltans]|eukprot:CUG87788.1 Hypothetical protein, putative [Bodo saltans]
MYFFRLWSERCRKDLRASERSGPREVWSVQASSLERHVLSRDINDRDRRFLNAGPSLLASLSRFVADSNATPQAEFVRSFSALRKEKTSRVALRAHGNRRAGSASTPLDGSRYDASREGGVAPSVNAAHRAVSPVGVGAKGEEPFPAPNAARTNTVAAQKSVVLRPTTAHPAGSAEVPAAVIPRPTTAMERAVTPTVNELMPSRPDFRRPLSAMMMQTTNPKWRHPVASSDVYGWQPTVNPAPYTDRRFQHPLSTTDVTRMGCMK